VRSANAKVAWRWNWAGSSVTGWVPVPEANDLDGFNTWLYARCGDAQQHIVGGLNATLSRLTSHRTGMAAHIEVRRDGELAARHDRSYGHGHHILNLEHYLDVLEKKSAAMKNSIPLQQSGNPSWQGPKAHAR
jgi:hypothetical protein